MVVVGVAWAGDIGGMGGCRLVLGGGGGSGADGSGVVVAALVYFGGRPGRFLGLALEVALPFCAALPLALFLSFCTASTCIWGSA